MRTTASFRLFGDADLTARAITSCLGIVPSTAYEAGDQVSTRSPGRRSSSLWLLSSGDIEEIELDEHLGRLLVVLEPVQARLWGLTDMGYRANWFCYVASSATEHAVELDRDLIARLLALPGDLWLDVSGDKCD